MTAFPAYHGRCGQVEFKNCLIPAGHILDQTNPALLESASDLPAQAINLGIGRAALHSAIEYAQLRVQGGQVIIRHQAIATILADAAIKLNMARSAIWQAAWGLTIPAQFRTRSIRLFRLGGWPVCSVRRPFITPH